MPTEVWLQRLFSVSLVIMKDYFSTVLVLKGRFLKFRKYHNFANLFSKLSETSFYKEICKF